MRRGLASEELARLVLESMGYTVKKMRHKVVIEGAEVAELDMVAVSPEGEEYGVEVKSGEISVSDVRQAYVSAKLANLRPMIVGRRLSSEAPQRLAQELGVKVVLLPEYVMLEPHELYDVVRRAVVDALAELLVPPGGLSEGELAHFGVPMVVLYRTSAAGILAKKLLLTTPHICLVNIIAGRSVVPELVYCRNHAEKIADMALEIIRDTERLEKMKQEIRAVAAQIDSPGASRRAAGEILTALADSNR